MKYKKIDLENWLDQQNIEDKLDKQTGDALDFVKRYFSDDFDDEGDVLKFNYKKWLEQHNIKKPFGFFYRHDSSVGETPMYWLSNQICFYFAMIKINGKPDFLHWLTKSYKYYYHYKR